MNIDREALMKIPVIVSTYGKFHRIPCRNPEKGWHPWSSVSKPLREALAEGNAASKCCFDEELQNGTLRPEEFERRPEAAPEAGADIDDIPF